MRRALFCLLLNLREEKEILLESHQAFEAAAAQTFRLELILLSLVKTGFSTVSIQLKPSFC